MVATVPSLVERVLPVLRRYGARRGGVVGSYARGEAGSVSDLDLLVVLPPGSSLLDLIGLEQDPSGKMGVKVEATQDRVLHPLHRDRVLQDEIRILGRTATRRSTGPTFWRASILRATTSI